MYKDWLRRGLQRPGKSQRGLAQHMGISESVVSRMVSGQRPMRGDEITAISVYLGEPPPGSAPTLVGRNRIVSVRVVGISLKGAFMDPSTAMKPKMETVAFVMLEDMESPDGVYGIEVIDPASQSLTHYICVPIDTEHRPLRSNDVVHYIARSGGLERHCFGRVSGVGRSTRVTDIDNNLADAALAEIDARGRVLAIQQTLAT